MISNTVRIIAGRFRGRRISFPTLPGVRPTPDRVRETVFNWLRDDIVGASVLDLFAGSGALGLEAASRGADKVVLVDNHRVVTEALQTTVTQLAINTVTIHQTNAMAFLQQSNTLFDIVFLDPPFHSNDLAAILPLIVPRLCQGASVYIETAKDHVLPSLPSTWSLSKECVAGQVAYRLYQCHKESA